MMSDKPTIHELEKILAEDDSEIVLNPDGSVDVSPSWKAHAEAAEARCERLKKAGQAALTFIVYNQGMPAEIERDLRAALSDTAQQETADGN